MGLFISRSGRSSFARIIMRVKVVHSLHHDYLATAGRRQ